MFAGIHPNDDVADALDDIAEQQRVATALALEYKVQALSVVFQWLPNHDDTVGSASLCVHSEASLIAMIANVLGLFKDNVSAVDFPTAAALVESLATCYETTMHTLKSSETQQ